MHGRAFGIALLAVLFPALAACTSSQEKLAAEDGSVLDSFFYGVLKLDRNPAYYYELVRDSHDQEGFKYAPSADKYIVDKNVDAVQRMGDARYARLEGQAQVVDLLSDVVLDDPSALAQANAANSLTRLGLQLPQYRSRALEERGDRFLSLVQEMDRIHAAGGLMQSNPGYGRRRTVEILQQIGEFEMATLILAKTTLKPFYTRPYLIDAQDAAVRQAADTALVKRMGEVVRLTLRAAVDAEASYVREEAIRGLKTLKDTGARDTVLARLAVENNWRVRSEGIESLGQTGGAEGVEALLPYLEHDDPTIKHKSRQALTRLAGRDLGFRRVTWTRWAKQRYPELAQNVDEDAGGSSNDASGLPPAMR